MGIEPHGRRFAGFEHAVSRADGRQVISVWKVRVLWQRRAVRARFRRGQ